MRLKKLHLRNFRKFADATFEFAHGLNVVVGPNEQGKSTMVHALVAGLFYDPLKKPSQDVLRHQRWNQDELYAIELIFESDGEEYVLVKDFQNKQLLLRGPKGAAWKTFPEVNKKIITLTGLSTPTLFESSACIYQDRVSELHASKAELARVLQELVATESQDVDVLSLLRALAREVGALKKGWDRTVTDPGLLRKTRDALETAQTQYDALQSRASEVSRFQDQRRETVVLQKQTTARYAIVSDLLASYSKRQELTRELEVAKKKFASLEDLQNTERHLTEKRTKIEQELRAFPLLLDPESQKTIQKISSLSAVLQARKNDTARKTVPDSFASRTKPDLWYFGITAIAVTIGVVGSFRNSLFFVFFVVAALFFGLGITEQTRRRAQLIDISGLEKEKIHETLLEEKELATYLTTFGVKDVAELLQQQQRVTTLQQDLREIDIRLDEIRKLQKSENAADSRMNAAAHAVALEKELAELPEGKKLTAEQYVALEREEVELRNSLETYANTLQRSEAIIEHTGVDESEVSELRDRITQLKNELAQLTNRLFIYEKIGTTLKAAQLSTMSSVRDTLQAFIQEHLPKITNGRYSDVRIGENLEIEVFSKERGDFVDPRENVSRGTIDQIYLMARFALAQAQAEGKYPPFLLDDPFVTFDISRKQETAKLLQGFSKNFQIFLFSYSDEYNAFADKVIEL